MWVRKNAISIKMRLYFSAVWSHYDFIKECGFGLILELGELPDESRCEAKASWFLAVKVMKSTDHLVSSSHYQKRWQRRERLKVHLVTVFPIQQTISLIYRDLKNSHLKWELCFTHATCPRPVSDTGKGTEPLSCCWLQVRCVCVCLCMCVFVIGSVRHLVSF